MNRNRILGLSSASLAALLSIGCGEKPFVKVDGQVITKDEYIHALEQTLAATPGGSVPAGRLVLEQMIGRKIILAEASAQGVLPSDDEINKIYRFRKDMLEQSQPGKNFEEELQKQGTTVEAFKENLRAESAEVAVLIKRLSLGNDKVQQYYTEHKEEFGLPARVQMRMVMLAPGTPMFAEAQKKLADPKNFTEQTARDLNVMPQLKVSGGLQVMPTTSIPPAVAAKVQQAAPGTVIGPIDWPMQGGTAKTWLKVEKKLPPYNVPIDDAAPIVRQRLILQLQTQNDPKFVQVRNEIIQKKFAANVETSNPVQATVWQGIKQNAKDAGLDKPPASATAPSGSAPAPKAGAPAPK